MASYDPLLLCDAAAKILRYSAPGTNTKVAMECAGFQKVNEEYGKYRKRIERQRNRLITSTTPEVVVVVPEGSTASSSTLSLSTDTDVSINVVSFIVLSMCRILTVCFICSSGKYGNATEKKGEETTKDRFSTTSKKCREGAKKERRGKGIYACH